MKETNPTKVTRFEVLCIDGTWRKITGTANTRDADTGCAVYAASNDKARAYESYGSIAALSDLAYFTARAGNGRVRVAA
jgi:hypothetical protein